MKIKGIRNISFRTKITCIFTVVCMVSTCITGIVYYKLAEREIVKSFTANAESLMHQLENTLSIRLEAVNRRAFAALTNNAFIQPLNDYLNAPDIKKDVVLSGEAAYWLKDIRMAEPLIHSTLIYTERGSWDDYTRSRNWAFDFENSAFGRQFAEHGEAIQWMPAMKDEIFMDEDIVIPYVRRFTASQSQGIWAYLIIQLDQKALTEELLGEGSSMGEILITDREGQYIAGTEGMKAEKLSELLEQSEAMDDHGNIRFDGEEYLMCRGGIELNEWQIYVLKSRAELLESMGRIRKVIVISVLLLSAACLVIVALLSRQLTLSLQRLALQMNRMRNGELDARYYYPYKDEVGSLARSFNYMADQVEKAMKKQEEYIQILKEERDFVEQVQKQKRKAELRALQAQINPHFLYNTLNTITWMASDQGMKEISTLSSTLGRFFRISLSKGAEVITIREEADHVKSYLTIQAIRYAEVMEYEIHIPEELMHCTILKLVLQPLVENSIYHGIKNKEGKGHIEIRAEQKQDADGRKWIQFVVEDDGAGIAPDKLERINTWLAEGMTEQRDGYGIFNVNERIKLYYGEPCGLTYESVEGAGTRAILTISMEEKAEDRCIRF